MPVSRQLTQGGYSEDLDQVHRGKWADQPRKSRQCQRVGLRMILADPSDNERATS